MAFFGFYLTDEHKLDYKLLESFYGLVGISNKKFANLEDLVNKYSNFFRLKIEGEVKNIYSIRALNKRGFLNPKTLWYVPFFAPEAPLEYYDEETGTGGRHIVDMNSIFEEIPYIKYDEIYSHSLTKLFNRFSKTEYFNSAPFDYILAPGVTDIILNVQKHRSPHDIESTGSLVPYEEFFVNLDCDEPDLTDTTLNLSFYNVQNFNRLISIGTSFGDKGTIALIDIPKIYNTYLRDIIKKETTEPKIKENLTDVYFGLQHILPIRFNSTREIYDRTYPLFNYQDVDKDFRLTRYNKFRPHRKFDTVPGSSIVVGAYVNEDVNDDFAPIAGPRSSGLFRVCHNGYIDMKNPLLFKVMFEQYGVSSLINGFDNNTYPVQQTTWKNSLSVLKQLHAFRIYVTIRRRAYCIAKSYLYETNTDINRKNLQTALNYLIYQFVDNYYIDKNSNANVWADISDIESHQIHIEMNVGIYGAIVKITVNMNLQDMTIEMI